MTDSIYLDQTTMLLHAYADTVKTFGRLNLHDINVHSENFFRDFLNDLRGLQLINVNDIWRNEPGVDLADFAQKIIIQVSSECTKKKIQDSLDKTNKTKYSGFHFYFLSLTVSADNLRNKEFTVAPEFTFAPTTDILDINSIVAEINSKRIEQKKAIYNLTTTHLQNCMTPQKNPTALSKVVEALDKALDSSKGPLQNVPFIIPAKIQLNNLDEVRGTINDHVIYSSMLNDVYSTGEQFGKTTRTKIHSMLRGFYEENNGKMLPGNLYRHITDMAFDMVMNSSNRPTDLMFEDIKWAVSVVVADAFEECKIFEHPKKLI